MQVGRSGFDTQSGYRATVTRWWDDGGTEHDSKARGVSDGRLLRDAKSAVIQLTSPTGQDAYFTYYFVFTDELEDFYSDVEYAVTIYG